MLHTAESLLCVYLLPVFKPKSLHRVTGNRPQKKQKQKETLEHRIYGP